MENAKPTAEQPYEDASEWKPDPVMQKSVQDAEMHVAIARRAVLKANALLQEYELRRAETDRHLARRGLTREQVLAFTVPEAQREQVDRELARLGIADETPPPADVLPESFDEANIVLAHAQTEAADRAGPSPGLRMLMRKIRI